MSGKKTLTQAQAHNQAKDQTQAQAQDLIQKEE